MTGRLISVSAGVAAAAVVVTLVALTLRQPDVPTYPPTVAAPVDAGRALVGPVLYTVDATSPDTWRYFSFRLGAVADDAGARGWDLGFRRYQVIANGGAAFVGQGAASATWGRCASTTCRRCRQRGTPATRGARARAIRRSPAGTATASSPTC